MTSIEKLKTEILSLLNISPEKSAVIGSHESLMENGLLDSMNILELVSHLEQTYDVEFSADDMTKENFETIDAIHKTLVKKNGPIE